MKHPRKAHAEIEEFCNILKQEGIRIRHSEIADFPVSYNTPDFESCGGFSLSWGTNIIIDMNWK